MNVADHCTACFFFVVSRLQRSEDRQMFVPKAELMSDTANVEVSDLDPS